MKTVYVGLSGGVDSAVSAALLKQQGYTVVGAYIKIWSPEFLECTWEQDRLDALRVSVALGIPFKEIDLSNEYMKGVVDDMIENYKKGVTPNPDVLCNRLIKFGAFSKWALEQGAEILATGHYAQVEKQGDSFVLKKGVDASKDQSYFLYRLDQKDLSRAMFPIGNIPKARVRELAQEFSLPVASKPDSQGLCFVGDVTMKDFLGRYIVLVKGEVIDQDKKVVGEHDGAALYTSGQRHGFTLNSVSSARGPFYVIRTDVQKNIVFVSTNIEQCKHSSCIISDMHWIGDAPGGPAKLSAVVRYHAAPVEITLKKDGSKIIAEFESPQLLTAGQSLVIYQDDICLGGGTIQLQ